MHYTRWRKRGDVGGAAPIIASVRGACYVEGCDRQGDSRGLCGTHRRRLDRHGRIDSVLNPKYRPMCPVCLHVDVEEIEAEMRAMAAAGRRMQGLARWGITTTQASRHRRFHLDNPEFAARLAAYTVSYLMDVRFRAGIDATQPEFEGESTDA